MEKKEEILKWLKQFKRLPTSRIMALVGLNLEYTKKYLEELEKENKIIKEEETHSVYWKLVGDKI
jgi:predicted transcriptional regulator